MLKYRLCMEKGSYIATQAGGRQKEERGPAYALKSLGLRPLWRTCWTQASEDATPADLSSRQIFEFERAMEAAAGGNLTPQAKAFLRRKTASGAKDN